jgi:transposase
VHNLSFQRWTDKDIAKFLNEEKKIEVSRSTVSRIRKQVESTAEKWYIELKKSSYKYIATYKERLDSILLSKEIA